MKALLQQIENGTIQPAQGLIIAIISVALILLVCHFLPEHKKAKR